MANEKSFAPFYKTNHSGEQNVSADGRKRFYIDGENFFLDGEKYIIRSGAIHYFRVPRFYWRDRLIKLKECGFNCVETYVAWNVHEPKKNEFDFDGEKDVVEFIKTAGETGLNVILRPGPFICAEWEGGGLPAWLLRGNDEEMRNLRIRCDNEPYLRRCEIYFRELFSRIKDLFVENGGNILMMQVENEYGSYGNDKAYLEKLVNLYRACGVNCLLFTTDGGSDYTVKAGNFPNECLTTLTFGSGVKKQMERFSRLQPNKPRMCAEFWCGWFDHWHEKHHVRDGVDVAEETAEFLKNGWSFNFYMFCGGTNFGFMNGANFTDYISPTVTSYDYCAPLTEYGHRTPTYYKLRETFIKYGINVPPLTAVDTELKSFGRVNFTGYGYLSENLSGISKPVKSKQPLLMEELGQNYGYIYYSCIVKDLPQKAEIILEKLSDRANVFINGEFIGRRESTSKVNSIAYEIDKNGAKSALISVLVENMGRVNYGMRTLDKKGLRRVIVDCEWVHSAPCDWLNYPLPMDEETLKKVNYSPVNSSIKENSPVFLKGEFFVDETADTFVRPNGLLRGFIVVNGFNIGRYDNAAGPQRAFYLPKCYLKKGLNEIVIFESDSASGELSVELVDKADYGETY